MWAEIDAEGYDYAEELEFGLDVLIEGLRVVRRAAQSRGAMSCLFLSPWRLCR